MQFDQFHERLHKVEDLLGVVSRTQITVTELSKHQVHSEEIIKMMFPQLFAHDDSDWNKNDDLRQQAFLRQYYPNIHEYWGNTHSMILADWNRIGNKRHKKSHATVL